MRPEAKSSLDAVVGILAINPEIKIEIMSHTDDVSQLEFNTELSQKRADEVVCYLVSRGVSPSRLKAKGYGESLPFTVRIKTNRKYPFFKEGQVLSQKFVQQLKDEKKKETARALNRRTEFRVLNK